MRFIRLKAKKVFKLIGLDILSTKLWFKYLGLKNGISIKYLDRTIELTKNKDKIIIAKGESFFGSIGIVVRDFQNFFETVKPIKASDGNNVIDFSVPKFHQSFRNNDEFFFHDICEPITVTDIYTTVFPLQEGNVVFDIGAYCGTQTVYFSRLVGNTGKVLAFEPDKTTFQSLKTNIEKHNLSNTRILNVGIFSHDGEVRFSGQSSMGSSIDDTGTISIQVNTLATVCQENSISKIDFIKMDIEGAEIDVLESSIEVIKKFKPCFIIEPHFKNGVLNDTEMLTIFKQLDYGVKILKQGEFDYQPLIYAFPNK